MEFVWAGPWTGVVCQGEFVWAGPWTGVVCQGEFVWAGPWTGVVCQGEFVWAGPWTGVCVPGGRSAAHSMEPVPLFCPTRVGRWSGATLQRPPTHAAHPHSMCNLGWGPPSWRLAPWLGACLALLQPRGAARLRSCQPPRARTGARARVHGTPAAAPSLPAPNLWALALLKR